MEDSPYGEILNLDFELQESLICMKKEYQTIFFTTLLPCFQKAMIVL